MIKFRTIIFTLAITIGLFGVASYAAAATFGKTSAAQGSLSSGLVGWWTFDGADIAGTQAYDKSGQNNTGTINGGITKTSGKIGQAMKFNGSTGYVNMGNVLNQTTDVFSVSAWAKYTTNGKYLISKYSTTDSGGYLIYDSGNGHVALFLEDTSVAKYVQRASISTINDGKWHFIVGVAKKSGSTFIAPDIYIDGVINNGAIGSAGTVNSVSSANVFTIGSDAGGTYNSAATIDDVRIWNRALSPSEVKQLYAVGNAAKIGASNTKNNSSGLAAYWTFDGKDITATQLLDRSGNNNTGTIVALGKAAGKIGQAGSFNGSNSNVYGNISSGIDTTAATGFTFSTWIYPTAAPGQEIYFSQQSAPPYFWVISGTTLYVYESPSNWTNIYNLPALRQWYHIVWTRLGSIEKMYVNSTLVNIRDNGNAGSGNVFNNFIIGASGQGSNSFYGNIDDTRMYRRALSSQEIKQLYLTGSETIAKTNTVSLRTGLVGQWTFDGPDTTATQILDRSGQGNAGTKNGGLKPVSGKIGQAMNFDGSTGYVSVSDKDVYSFGNGSTDSPLTFAAWVKTSVSDAGIILSKDQNPSGVNWVREYVFVIVGGNPLILLLNNDQSGKYIGKQAVINISSGSWRHVVVTYDGSKTEAGIKIYVDGVLATLSSYSALPYAGMSNTSVPLDIGRRLYSGGSSNFNGSMDDVRIYNRALSASEVQQLYAMGK